MSLQRLTNPLNIPDLILFEKSIRETIRRLGWKRIKYSVFLTLLSICVIASYGAALYIWWCGSAMPTHVSTTVIASSSALILFFLTGLFTAKIHEPSRYIERLNTALRTFNLEFESGEGLLKHKRYKISSSHSLDSSDSSSDESSSYIQRQQTNEAKKVQ